MAIKACVFDAYGTLFDVAAAARRAASEPGGERLAESWGSLAEIWRLKQLEYSWLRAVADDYKPFWQVTEDALDYALESEGIDDEKLRAVLLGLYKRLDAYPEVPAMLQSLKDAGLTTAILSNGSMNMLDSAVESAGIRDSLDAVLSVEDVGIFKPSARVYALSETRLGCRGGEIAFFSSNCWDATHASAYGFKSIWVNRKGAPVDRVGSPPLKITEDLTGAAEIVGGL